MTSNDPMSQSGGSPRSLLAELLILLGLLVVLMFCLGVAAGYFGARSQGSLTIKDYFVGSAIMLVAVLACWQLAVRSYKLIAGSAGKLGPKTRKVRNLWVFFILLGGAIGAALALLDIKSGSMNGDLPKQLFTGQPVSAEFAAIVLIGMAFAAVASVFYYRYIDEHERAAQADASLVAINFYIALEISWWVSAKGQLVGPVNHGAVFLAVMLVWSIVWLWRRYR